MGNPGAAPSKIPDMPQRGPHPQAVPVADDLDLPPSYEEALAPAPLPAPESASGPESSHSHPPAAADALARAESEASWHLHSPADSSVDPNPDSAIDCRRGYRPTNPMFWDMRQRRGDWDRHVGKPGFCASTTAGCCCSARGGACFSDRGGCFCSDRKAFCFSDRGGCCCSDAAGCCFSSGGALCFSDNPVQHGRGDVRL